MDGCWEVAGDNGGWHGSCHIALPVTFIVCTVICMQVHYPNSDPDDLYLINLPFVPAHGSVEGGVSAGLNSLCYSTGALYPIDNKAK